MASTAHCLVYDYDPTDDLEGGQKEAPDRVAGGGGAPPLGTIHTGRSPDTSQHKGDGSKPPGQSHATSQPSKQPQQPDEPEIPLGSQLCIAIKANSIWTVELLLDAGADPNYVAADGTPAIHFAVSPTHEQIFDLLLLRGASINAQDVRGKSLLHVAVQCRYEHLYGKFTLESKTLEALDDRGNSPLDHALLHGNWDAFKVLASIHTGLSLNVKLQSQSRPVHDTEQVTTTFALEWEMPGFFLDELLWEFESPGSYTEVLEATRAVSVLLGQGHSYEYCTCGSFLASKWGEVAESCLEIISTCLTMVSTPFLLPFSLEAASKKLNATILKVTRKAVVLRLRSFQPQSEQLIEALTWMCQSIRHRQRPSILSASNETACKVSNAVEAHRYYRLFELSDTLFTHPDVWERSGSPLQRSGSSSTLTLHPSESRDQHSRDLDSSKTYCWTRLFQRVTITEQPVLKLWGLGLRIPFEVMVHLAAVESYCQFGGGTILIGFYTALVPTAWDSVTQSIQWHFEDTKDSQQLMRPEKLHAIQQPWFQTEDISMLQKSTCYLGWSAVAKLNLGTKDLLETQRFQFSCDTKERLRSLHSDGYEASAQLGFTLSPINLVSQATKSVKYVSKIRRFTPSASYMEALMVTSRKVALVIDSQSKRSWLVPYLSLALHLCHRYFQEYDKDNENHDPIPYAEASTDGAEAAIHAMQGHGGVVVFGSKNDEDSETLRHLFLRINLNMMAAIREQSDEQHIFATELMDIIREPSRGSPLKAVQNSSASKTWRRLADVVDLVTVCSGIGEVIEPVFPGAACSCCLLPEGRDYLAAHVACLNDMCRCGYKEHTSQSCKIGQGLTWSQKTQVPARPCLHGPSCMWEGEATDDQLFQTPVGEKSPVVKMNVVGADVHTEDEVIGREGVVVFGARQKSDVRRKASSMLRRYLLSP